MPTLWAGHYFDGRRAARHDVRVAILPDRLRIIREDGGSIWWPYADVRQTQGAVPGEPVRLERGTDLPEALVVSDPAFIDAIRQISSPGARVHPPSRRLTRLSVTLLALAGIIAVSAGLYLWGIPALADAVARHIPLPWEERLGQAVIEAVAPEDHRCRNAAALRAIEQIVSRLLAAAPASPYVIRVSVDDDPLINALAAPGGHIVVFRNLLERTDSPEELAGVLAHEIQHVLQRHGTRALVRELSLRALIGLVTGDTRGITSALQTAGAVGGLRYRRSDEEIADRDGMKMLQTARIDPQGMIRFFAKLERELGVLPRALSYLSTHPSTADRLLTLQRLAAEAHDAPVGLLPGVAWSDVRDMCRR